MNRAPTNNATRKTRTMKMSCSDIVLYRVLGKRLCNTYRALRRTQSSCIQHGQTAPCDRNSLLRLTVEYCESRDD
ncbi:MAG: hypothetical protein ACJAYX_003338 [Planctomycetota bacterium]|jgi:hypothetical protein